jgi:L-serine deaminase
MSEVKNIEAKIYAVGTEKGRSVVWAMVGGSKWVIPTDLLTMSRLAERGIPVKNEA